VQKEGGRRERERGEESWGGGKGLMERRGGEEEGKERDARGGVVGLLG